MFEFEFEALCLQNGTWTRRNGSECLCVGGFEPRLSQGCRRKYILSMQQKSAHKNLYYMAQATSGKILIG